jgi:hypothetical protein
VCLIMHHAIEEWKYGSTHYCLNGQSASPQPLYCLHTLDTVATRASLGEGAKCEIPNPIVHCITCQCCVELIYYNTLM